MEGLSNRMRVIDSALVLCEKYQIEIKIFWVRDLTLNCPYVKLFKPLELDGIYFFDLPTLPYKYRVLYNPTHLLGNILKKLMYDKVIIHWEFQKLFEEKFQFESLLKYKHVFVSSFSRFYSNGSMYKLFKPIDELQQKIEERTKNFSVNTVGVHIRRTDHKNSTIHSPTELFIKVMKEEIKINPETNFYLASDSVSIKQELEREFKDRIMTEYEEVSRESIKGCQEALVDLYSLSKTQKIFGSYYSSFSETAAHISGIEMRTIKV